MTIRCNPNQAEPNEPFQVTPTNCEEMGKLGSGSFGSVTRVRHQGTGTVMALKKIPFNTELEYEKYRTTEKEMLETLNNKCQGVV